MARIPKDWVSAYFDYGVDVTNRRVFLFDDVSSDSIGAVIKGLYLMESISQEKAVELFIGSFGGDEYEMFALYDVLQTLKAPVHTVAIGKCMSAAPLLVAAGHPGERWTTPNTSFMVHQSWGDWGDKRTDEVKKELAHNEAMAKSWYNLMARHTKKTALFWRRHCEKVGDHFFTAEQAVEWGLVDAMWAEKE